jgi:hypothetical protein
MYQRGLNTQILFPLAFEKQELKKLEPTQKEANDVEAPDVILRLKPYLSKGLIVNNLGATGEGFFQAAEDEKVCFQVKQALALNFKNGKLKVSMAGQI